MTPEQLKLSILQYAMQGKLVEQMIEEGNAREFYEQIVKKKKELIKEGKIKRQKVLSEITTAEIPFDIPENWEWVRLGNLITLQSGQDLKKSEYNDNQKGIPYLTGASNIKNNGNIIINRWTEVPKTFATTGDLLLTCKGTVGKMAFVEQDKVHIARQIMGIKAYYTDLRYIKYFLKTQISNLKSMAKSMIPGIERSNVLNLIIPLPPLEEQKRIVAKIEEILPLVDRYYFSWTKLKQLDIEFSEKMKKSILQYAIQGKLVEQRPEEGTAEELYKKIQGEKNKLIQKGKIKKQKKLAEIKEDEIPFDIPNTWKWVRLGNLINLQSGQDLKKSEYNDNQKGIPYLTGASNIKNNGNIIINRWTETPKAFAITGDLLLTCKGTVGKMAFVKQDKVHIARQIMGIRTYCTDLKYTKYFLETQISNLKSMAKSMIPGIERNNVLNLIIPLPPLDEQKRIVTKIEELIPYCEQLIK